MQWDLDRFLKAQTMTMDGHDDALDQLQQGTKTGHWMWYVFPQIQGLGLSDTARDFAIASLDEARAYVAHPVLGARLRECARTLLASDRTAGPIFESTDCKKLRSSMTLFAHAAPDEPLFGQVIDRFFDGLHDGTTCDILCTQAAPGPDMRTTP